jgi:hypothetical protein
MSCVLAPPPPTGETGMDLRGAYDLMSNAGVIGQLAQRCSGLIPDSTDIFTTMPLSELSLLWETGDCASTLNNFIFLDGSYSLNRFTATQLGMTNAMNIYFSAKPFETSVFRAPEVQSQMLNACSIVPGLCSFAASSMCGSCSREQIASSYETLQLCGCYAPQDPNFGTLTGACDPLCTNSASSRLRDPASGSVAECNQTVCVINDVTINATNSSLQGINFSQVCSQCANDNSVCQCFIDVSIPDIISTVGLSGPTLSQNCPFSQCFTVNNETGTINNVSCSPYNPINVEYPVSPWLWWILAFLFFVLVTVIFAFAYWGDSFQQIGYQPFEPAKKLANPWRYSSRNLP